MTTYMTQKQATAIVHSVKRAGDYLDTKDLCNAAIQAYRDSLVAGVVLPEPAYRAAPYSKIGADPTSGNQRFKFARAIEAEITKG